MGTAISVDMLKQYFMRQITESNCRNWVGFASTRGGSQIAVADNFRVHQDYRTLFFELVCNHIVAEAFLDNYVPANPLA